MTPEYSKDGLKAVYELDGLELREQTSKLNFVRYEGRWYFSDL